MIVCNENFYQRGATMTEVILAVAVVIAVSPFLYNQIVEMSYQAQDITIANRIVKTRDEIMNFLRVYQNDFADDSETKMTDEQIQKFAPLAHTGFVDRYKINGATISDVYLAFDIPESGFRIANIAKQIGEDAAIVREDGVAYSQSWAVSAPEDFAVGDLIYKISRDFNGSDKSKFLHRGTMGEDGLNQMQRDLHMNNFNMFNASNVDGVSVKSIDCDIVFLESDIVDTDELYFSSGAVINSVDTEIGSMRVTGDANGFKMISADKLNGDKYTTSGRLIADRTVVGNSINVANNLILKSTSSKSVSGFSGISANKVLVPYVVATDMVFYENFGIIVSGELLLAGTPPLKIGSWVWPSRTPPSFSKFILTRATLPDVPDTYEFRKIMDKNWQTK